jgi:hypothetical protein
MASLGVAHGLRTMTYWQQVRAVRSANLDGQWLVRVLGCLLPSAENLVQVLAD